MSNLKSLLQDADPIRHEAPLADTQREQLWTAIRRNVSAGRPGQPMRARLALAAAIGIAMLSAVAMGYGIWAHGATPVVAAVRFEVRLAEEMPIQGAVVAKVPDSDRLIYLHPEIVVSNDDIAQSWVAPDGPDRFSIGVQFLPSGAERMRQATATHVGRPLAILIDGKVVMAPVLKAPISGDSATITGNYTRAEAERIADGMRLH